MEALSEAILAGWRRDSDQSCPALLRRPPRERPPRRALPETRRKSVPAARLRTSLCADGLGKCPARRSLPGLLLHLLDEERSRPGRTTK